MVQLDHALFFRASRLVTGANVHRVKGLIFAYEQAVLLHNEGRRSHNIYHDQYEKELRQFVQENSFRKRRGA